MALLAFAFSLRGIRARAERDPERAGEPLWSLQAPARCCIHSWPEWAPECDGVGPYHGFGPSGILSVSALVLTSAFVWHLCSAQAGSQACLQARPRQNFERICGLLRVKPEDGASSG